MNANLAKRLLLIGLAVVVVAAVAGIAYYAGANAFGSPMHPFGMMRGYRAFGGDAYWSPLGGLVTLGVLVLVVWLIAGFFRTPGGAPFSSPDAVARLRELAEMHDRGALSDEEFTAAKRKLLGL